ncbi:hypothetical protein IJ531_03215, partial [bacterium]|nr:hypothetical protein [bacterium]
MQTSLITFRAIKPINQDNSITPVKKQGRDVVSIEYRNEEFIKHLEDEGIFTTEQGQYWLQNIDKKKLDVICQTLKRSNFIQNTNTLGIYGLRGVSRGKFDDREFQNFTNIITLDSVVDELKKTNSPSIELTKISSISKQEQEVYQKAYNALSKGAPLVYGFFVMWNNSITPEIDEKMIKALKRGLPASLINNLSHIYLSENEDYFNLSIKNKLDLCDNLASVVEDDSFDDAFDEDEKEHLRNLLITVQKLINKAITPTDVELSDIRAMMSNFFANHSEVEEVLKQADFTPYEKTGLPLKYPKEQFLADLENILSYCSAQ